VVDEIGAPFARIFTAVARGPHFYLLTETALFKLETTQDPTCSVARLPELLV
jgi:hypothetical protein